MKRFVILALVLLVACGGGSSYQYQSRPRATSYQVTYRVTGSPGATADVTYENEGGNGEQQDGVRLPWTKTYQMEYGDFMYISAQILIDGRIKCEIMVDGKVAETAESTGRYVIASCSGSAGR